MTDDRSVETTVARGFTLLELILCIFVLSLFLTLALPSFTGVGQRKAEADAKMAASVLRLLYDSALSRKETFTLTVDLNRKALSYQRPEGDRSETFTSLRSVTVPSRGQLSEGEITITFTGLGIPENLRLTFDNGSRPDIVVMLSHLSGKVSLTHEDTGAKDSKR